VTTFLVECFWPGVTWDAVLSANRRARERAIALRHQGSSLHFLGSLFVPEDETVFFQYTAASGEEVVIASRQAELPFSRITSSLWLDSDEEPSI
jgi:hypothetical protein